MGSHSFPCVRPVSDLRGFISFSCVRLVSDWWMFLVLVSGRWFLFLSPSTGLCLIGESSVLVSDGGGVFCLCQNEPAARVVSKYWRRTGDRKSLNPTCQGLKAGLGRLLAQPPSPPLSPTSLLCLLAQPPSPPPPHLFPPPRFYVC